jgi:hypothetical protein
LRCGADNLCRPRAGGGIARHETEEDLRANADADSAETREEKDGRGEIADAEADCNTGEIAVAEKEEGVCVAFSFGNPGADGVFFAEEKENVAEPVA